MDLIERNLKIAKVMDEFTVLNAAAVWFEVENVAEAEMLEIYTQADHDVSIEDILNEVPDDVEMASIKDKVRLKADDFKLLVNALTVKASGRMLSRAQLVEVAGVWNERPEFLYPCESTTPHDDSNLPQHVKDSVQSFIKLVPPVYEIRERLDHGHSWKKDSLIKAIKKQTDVTDEYARVLYRITAPPMPKNRT